MYQMAILEFTLSTGHHRRPAIYWRWPWLWISDDHNRSLNRSHNNKHATGSFFQQLRATKSTFFGIFAMTLLLSYIFICMTSIFYFRTKFYYRIPTTGPGKYENQFLRPLTMSVWWCVIAMINLCGMLLFITSKIEGRSSGVQYALFSVLASFCQQCQYQ